MTLPNGLFVGSPATSKPEEEQRQNILELDAFIGRTEGFLNLGTVSGNVSINLAYGIQFATVSTSATFAFANPSNGSHIKFMVEGGGTIAFSGSYNWPSGIEPQLVVDETTIIDLVYVSGVWYGTYTQVTTVAP